MELQSIMTKIVRSLKQLAGTVTDEIQPRDIFERLLEELEKKKKIGIETSAFVPNVYTVFLCPVDYEDIEPLLTGIKDQIKSKLMERLRKGGYKILSASLELDIREDSGLQKNRVVVESAFIKDSMFLSNAMEAVGNIQAAISPLKSPAPQQGLKDMRTILMEDKKTRIMDNSNCKIEILEGENKGDIISLSDGDYTFGRGKDAAIQVKDREETVSRLHFKVSVKPGQLGIRDLNSANGTKVNGKAIEASELKKNDIITAGKVLLKVA